jgi:hypothetical protein
MSVPTRPINSHPACHARTISTLLDMIAAALNADGATVLPDDIDSAGMTIVIDGMSYRLEIAEPELMDDADWRHRVLSTRPAMLVKTGMSHPKVGLNGYAVDPAGFNGMEVHND